MSDDSSKGPTQWRWPLGLIAAGLLVWGALFALGAYLDLGGERPDDNSGRDWQKGLIVLGCTLGFLAFWGLALWNRSRRLRKLRSAGQSFQADGARESGWKA